MGPRVESEPGPPSHPPSGCAASRSAIQSRPAKGAPMSRTSVFLAAALFAATACRSGGSPGTAGSSTEPYDGYRRTSQYLTMRDGTRLAADILRPTKGGKVHDEKLPVVLTHHRYNRPFLRNDSITDYASG